MAHKDYVVKERREDGTSLYECGCLWRGFTCKIEDMCAEGRETALAIKRYFTDTEEGRARIEEVRREAGI